MGIVNTRFALSNIVSVFIKFVYIIARLLYASVLKNKRFQVGVLLHAYKNHIVLKKMHIFRVNAQKSYG